MEFWNSRKNGEIMLLFINSTAVGLIIDNDEKLNMVTELFFNEEGLAREDYGKNELQIIMLTPSELEKMSSNKKLNSIPEKKPGVLDRISSFNSYFSKNK